MWVMKRKKFIKLAMSEGMDRNEANFAARIVLFGRLSYAKAYQEFDGMIKGRYEFYMPGHEKKVAKRNKKYQMAC
jgi:hypothetical protein